MYLSETVAMTKSLLFTSLGHFAYIWSEAFCIENIKVKKDLYIIVSRSSLGLSSVKILGLWFES
jgi:hypothetical protein